MLLRVAGEYKVCFTVRVYQDAMNTKIKVRRLPWPLAACCSNGALGDCRTCPNSSTSFHTLQIDFRTGVSATDWNAIAKKEHLDALTVELRKLEDSIREVYSEMLLLQQRESEMREISGAKQAGLLMC